MRSLKVLLTALAVTLLCSTMFAQTYNAYYGDVHNHTNISDGTGTPDGAYRYARDNGKLDFFAIADHCGAYSSTDWTNLKSTANRYNKDGSFVALWGFEWTDRSEGHVAVIGTSSMTSVRYNSTFPSLVRWLNSQPDGVAFFNHPGRQDVSVEFGQFKSTAPSMKFVGMELFNKSTAFSRYLFNDGYVRGDNLSFYEEANARGWKIGAAGGGDNHTANWGIATDYRLAVLATSLSRASIMDAFRARRFYSTLDKNLKLSFQIDGKEMGSTVSGGNKTVKIVASDANSERFTEVELFKNGVSFKRWNIATVGANISESISIADGDILYVVVTQGDRDQACSSPIWVKGGSGGDNKPTVSITSPVTGATFKENGTISIKANASDDKGVSKVEFYNGTTRLGSDSYAPYSYDWNFVTPGTYYLKAVATDTAGQTAASAEVKVVVQKGDITIDLPPTASLTAPTSGSLFKVGNSVTLKANASDDVSLSKVEFYVNNVRVGSDSVAAYSVTWKPSAAGSYDIKAVAIDSKGQKGESAIITVRVEDGGINPGNEWKAGVSYNVGDVVTYKGVTYVCKFAHVSNAAWYPGLPGLWFWTVK